MTKPAMGPASRTTAGERALRWWQEYCQPTKEAGTRARLRRARSRLEILQIAPAVLLARQLGAVSRARPASDTRLHAALDLSRVLAHVTVHEPRHPMEAAGWAHFPGDRKESDAGEDDRPLLSEARFRRLLETGDGEEKVLAFTRLVDLLGGRVNVAQLASDFLHWNHPDYGDRIRERWAFHYLAAGSAAPAAPSIDSEDEGE